MSGLCPEKALAKRKYSICNFIRNMVLEIPKLRRKVEEEKFLAMG